MVYTFIRHKIADYELWKATYEANASWRRGLGEIGSRVFRDADNATIITVIEEWADYSSAQFYTQSLDLVRKMQDARVIGEPSIFILTELTANEK